MSMYVNMGYCSQSVIIYSVSYYDTSDDKLIHNNNFNVEHSTEICPDG